MTPEQLQTVKETLIAAADKFIAEGGEVIDKSFRRTTAQGVITAQCPIECILAGQVSLTYAYQRLTQVMGFEITNAEMWDFIDAFDGNEHNNPERDTPMTALGRELRTKYIKEQST